MDKSLDELIAEQRSKGKRRERSDHGKKPEAESRGRDRRHPGSNRDSRRDSKKQDAAGPPPRDPAYFEHDDRQGGWGGREQQGGVPRGSWKQQQQRQQWQGPRGRGGVAAGTDPIITTADGWEEVAQDDPYVDRRGGSGAQRRGGVFDRLTYSRGDRANGSHGGRWDRQQQQQQQPPYGGGGHFGRGRGRGGRGPAGDWEGEPRRRYVDEHDHRDDQPGGGAGRPGRFQPYRVAGGVSKRSSRGPQSGGRKWGHDLFDPNQEATAAAAAADEEEAADAGAMME